jgi:hypothetical protein
MQIYNIKEIGIKNNYLNLKKNLIKNLDNFHCNENLDKI